jgi:hypothetical protein
MPAGFVWIVLRLAVVGSVTFDLFGLDPTKSNIHEWSAAILGIIPGVGIYLWLSMIRYREWTDFSHMVSLQKPFLPMSRFPLRFWFVASYSMLIGGAVAMLVDTIQKGGRGPIDAVFFLWERSLP